MSIKIGLDFGTSNSGAAVFDGHKVRLLPVDPTGTLPEVIKTILYITRDGKHYIGQEAMELYYRQNINRLRRYVRKWAGEIEVIGGDMYFIRDVYVYVDELRPGRLLQYLKTILRKGAYSGTQIFEQFYRPADLVQAYLSSLRQRAEAILGEPVRAVTLGRPVKFNDDPGLDRKAEETLRLAAHQAGFEQVDFELEPVAAALAYEQSLTSPQTTLIFDFGGGTLDIAILRLGDPKNRAIYANGGIDIAGSDFDRAIIEQRLLKHFGKDQVRYEPDLFELVQAVPDWVALPELSTPQNWQSLEDAIQRKTAPVQLKRLQSLIFNDLAFTFYNQVESAKIALSGALTTVIALREQGIDLWELYTRGQFELDIASYQAQIEQVLLNTLDAAGKTPEEIDAVVKTGGSSSIPLFNRMLERIFGASKVKAASAFSSVTAGLAIRAYRGPDS